MKDKTTTALLSLFLGFLGVHRFYLRQTGLGVLYFFLLFFFGLSFFLGIIDFFRFLFMDEEDFQYKYNRRYAERRRAAYDTDFDRQRNRRPYQEERQAPPPPTPAPRRRATPTPVKTTKSNPYTQRGIEKYRNFDYYGAIGDFVKALETDAENVPLHFNLACAYSLTEQADQSFFHLNKAVEHGFKDFEKIRSHDALAYIRIRDDFDTFAKNGYRLLKPEEQAKQGLITANPDLLEQLRQLGELRERELLTEEEFLVQKRKLLE